MNNKVIRKCDHCGLQCDQENWRFTYLSDDVWSCAICGSKYTHIAEVINPEEEQT